MVTIYDIAKATGYSAPTVSKALNGTGYLSDATRQKIIEISRAMGYEPSSIARSLATKRTYLIGVIYDDTKMNRGFGHPLFAGILDEFRENVENAGYDIIFLSRHNKMSYVSHSNYRSVEGVAIINPDTANYDEFEEFAKRKIPCVSTNAVIPGICTILTDNKKAGYAVAEYLFKMGHKKIGILGGPSDKYTRATLERKEGFETFLKEHNLSTENVYFQECEFWHAKAGYEGFAKLYKAHSDITAVFATSDLLAIGITQFTREHHIELPTQLSIVGFDDDNIAKYMHPSLTTFRQDAKGIADLAAELLLQKIIGLPTPTDCIRIGAEFIMRDSVLDITQSRI